MTTRASYCLVVPTFNRPHRLDRLLSFLEHKGFRAPVIVLDSSDEEQALANRRRIEKVSAIEVEQVRFATDTFFYEKMYQGVKERPHAYMALCADDDIAAPTGVERLVGMLEADGGCSMAHGITTQFWERRRGEAVLDLEYRPIPYDQESPLRRLQAVHERFESTVWSVYRTPVLRRAMDLARKTGNFLFGEMATVCVALAAGRCGALPVPHIHRSSEGRAAPISKWHPMFWALRDRIEFLRCYQTYRSALIEHLTDHAHLGVPRDRAEAFLDLCFIGFFCPQWNPNDHRIRGFMDGLIGGGAWDAEASSFRSYTVSERGRGDPGWGFPGSWVNRAWWRMFPSRVSGTVVFRAGNARVGLKARLLCVLPKEEVAGACADIAAYMASGEGTR